MFKDSEKTKFPKSKAPHEEVKEHMDSIFYWLSKESEKTIDYKRNLIQLSRDLIHNKYYDTFNFYFSKPINEIIAGVSVPHVISYKDNLYYDEETEYLKRFYKKDETKPRMEKITNFYFTLTEGAIRTSLPLHEQNTIILKRNDKLNKLLLSKLQNLAEVPQTQGDTNQQNPSTNALTDRREDARIDDQRIRETASIQENKTNTQTINEVPTTTKLNEGANNTSYQKILKNDETQENSFDSARHDIFNPNLSAEDLTKDSPVKPKNDRVYSRRKEIKGGDVFLEAPYFEPKRSQAPKEARVPQIDDQDDFYWHPSLENEDKLIIPKDKAPEFDMKETVKEKEVKQEFTLSNSISFSKKEVSLNTSQNESKGLLKSQNAAKDSGNNYQNSDDTTSLKPQNTNADSKNSQKDGRGNESESSTTHIHISAAADENATGDRKFQVITIKNIQINQIAPITTLQPNNDIQSAPNVGEVNQQPPLSKRPSQPEYRASADSHFRPAETLFTEDSVEKDSRSNQITSKTSADHVKELMKKYYKLSDGDGQPITERFKESTILAKLAGAKYKSPQLLQLQQMQQSQQKNKIFINTTLRSSLLRESPRYQKERSNTEATLLQSSQTFRGTNPSPKNSINIQIGSVTARMNTSPSSQRRSHNRLKSNDGVLLTQDSLATHHVVVPPRRSPENCKSFGDMGQDPFQSVNNNADPKKAQHNKSKSSVNFIFQKSHLKGNPSIGGLKLQEPLSSARPYLQNSQPVSATNAGNVKLELGNVNPQTKFENIQGFLSCRSAKADDMERMAKPDYAQIYKESCLRQKYKQSEGLLNKAPQMRSSLMKNQMINKPSISTPRQPQGYLPGSKIMEKKTPPSSRTGSISFPNNQFININKKLGK